MAKMTDLLYHIPNIVPQTAPIASVSAADGLYNKFYSPIESFDPLLEPPSEEDPTLSDMSSACDYIMSCFEFGRKLMLGDYMRDLFFFRLLFVCGVQLVSGSTGGTTENKYQDILDEIESRWTGYAFSVIDTYMTFAIIKAM